MEIEFDVTQATTQAARPRYVLTTQPYVHAPTAEDAWTDEPPGSHPVVQWAWTGQEGIGIGDLIAIYVTDPDSAICWLGRAISSAYANPRRPGVKQYWFWLEMTPLRDPVTLEQMRRDPRLSEWGPVVQNFQGGSRRVKADLKKPADPYWEWDALAQKGNGSPVEDIYPVVFDWYFTLENPLPDDET